jgi:hypothetical protein
MYFFLTSWSTTELGGDGGHASFFFNEQKRNLPITPLIECKER